MFLRLIAKSMKVRKSRVIVALLAVVAASAVASALLTLSLDTRDKIGRELRGYGANLVLLPGEGEYIVKGLKLDHPSVAGYSTYLYTASKVKNQEVPVVGVEFEAVKRVRPWWRISGDSPLDGKAVVGANLANKLGLKIGSTFELGSATITMAGLIDTGGVEDDQIFINLREAQKMVGVQGVSAVEVSVLGDVAEVTSYLEKNNNVMVKKIRQTAEAEEVLLAKTELLLASAALFVFAAACLGVMSTMITSVLERGKEIGLMKALGAENSSLLSIFLAEAAIIGVAGGLLGYLLGFAFAQFIGIEVFSLAVSPRAVVIPAAVFTSLLASVLGSIAPIRRATAIDPIVTLRGE